ncbi:DIDO1 protein, partial [Rhinopomastus cyanomelas]|nr:DIDO1 protein [Rhinopomastus cyanomelas]
LSGLNSIWTGFINLHSVTKFVTKAYPVSGCSYSLAECLPGTIHIGGRISPKDVWDYVDKLQSSQELCLIRFHPVTEDEEVGYACVYSYLASRYRFGVIINTIRNIKDFYLMPLSSQDPIPPKLLPLAGPG